MTDIPILGPKIDPYEVFQRAIADALDRIRAFTPPSFEVNLVLRHKDDPKAHMLIGQSQPLKVRQAIEETLADRGLYEMTGNRDEGFEIVDAEKVQ